MTRINVVPVATLSVKHLCAEYRELPRVFALAHKASQSKKPWTDKQPSTYRLGSGHVYFFYDKLKFLSERHKLLVSEMLSRGYKPSFTGSLEDQWKHSIPQGYWKDWMPDEEAVKINVERIKERTK